MKIEKKLWITLFVFGIFAICFSGWIFHKRTEGEKIFFDNTGKLETVEYTEDGIRVEKAVLPEAFDFPKSILFKTTHTVAEVWLNGEKIYQYGKEENAPGFMRSPGTYWHIVDIPENSAGKELELRIFSVYDGYYGNAVNLVFGTRGDCILKIMGNSLGTLIISCGILFAGIVSLILYIGAVKNRRREKTEAKIEIFLNLGVFSMLIAIWTLRQCGFLQFLIPDGRTLYFVDFFTFFLFPVPFNFLLYDICKSKYHKGALYFSVSYLVNMTVAVALQCMGIIDIFRILPVTHILLLLNVIYAIVLIHYEARNRENEDAWYFRYPMYIIMCFGLTELILYYVKKFQNTSIFLPLGTMIFIIMLIWIQVSRYYDEYIQRQKFLYVQKLAHTDMLTKAMNRNAYEDEIRYLNTQKDRLQNTGVVLFDLDNLKIINDNFGHEKGDEALRLCYHCMKQIFKEEKNCFRIGGDEFAYVYHDDEKEQIADLLKKLNSMVKEKAGTLSYPFSVSAGYAYCVPETDEEFQDIVRRSDAMLYRQKRRKKKYQSIKPAELCSVIDLLSPTIDDYLYLIDFRTDFYYIAPQALDRFCIQKNAFHHVMDSLKSFVYAPDYGDLKNELSDLLGSGRCIHNMEYRWMDHQKMPVWINCRGQVVRDDNLKPLYMIGCINEIGQKQKADNVSGLMGESSFRAYMEQPVASWEKGCLLRIGIDHFKDINENFGQEYGDFVLKKTASCISRCLSEDQKVYKLLSDEFMVLDRTSDSTREAGKLYARIRESIDRFIEDNAFSVMFTVSGGILPLHDPGKTDYSEIIKLTDFSLNEAKKRGRNRCYVFDEKDYQRFLRKREITQEMREAIHEDFRGFTAFLQPVFRSEKETARLYGAEVLMRFSSQKFGMVSPAEFIPILEESGLIIPAGRWIMKEAMEKCREIRKKIPGFRVSINISQVQASKSDVILDIAAEMKKTGILADALIVELTESDLLEQNINEKHFLTELKKLGIELALDDFGTGYSNFHYLSELNPAIIKIDRSFTARAVADEGEYYLLKQFCSMIHNLGMQICIEGVENTGEWEKIRQLYPDYSQGYLWGKPCPYEEFVEQFVK